MTDTYHNFMKKIFLLLFLAVFSTGLLRAVNYGGEVDLGINVSTMSEFHSKVGFRFGIRGIMHIPEIANGVYVNAGAFLSKKGGQIEEIGEDENDIITVSASAYYLEVPIHIGFRCEIIDAISVFTEVGPYFGAGLFGDTKIKTSQVGEDKFHTFGDDKLLDRFDLGIGMRAGIIIFGQVPISVGYDFGLLNNSALTDIDIKHSNFTASIGWIF